MDTAPLKSFATRARTDLIAEVSAGVRRILAPASAERVEQAGAVAALEKAISTAGGGETGRAAVADKVAYTWFNRIIALRFMDANGYTGIGVVSPPRGQQGGQPEILAEAKRGTIDTTVVTSKSTLEAITGLLDGTRRSDDPQGEAYALLLAEYCRHWNRAMPFMFEREGDYTELLIPANLLADDSVLARAMATLTEDVCQDVEVIGWLYQFYISERHDEVFAGFKKNKKAGAAEIPAATQLFTPHWIVRYLVENSLGRLWLLNQPSSRLAERMDYYIAPVDEETDYLKVTSPEELKIIDPACGSGHMLTYAFDLLYAIYQEEGYAPADIPSLIFTRNLYGTEIDPRAGALAAFALTMKARARQRTFFTKRVQPKICVLEPITFTPTELDLLVTPDGDRAAEEAFWNAFEHADRFGSLIEPDQMMTVRLGNFFEQVTAEVDLATRDMAERARRVLIQAEFLSPRYSVVVANPPYMGQKNMSSPIAEWLKEKYPSWSADLFSAATRRYLELVVGRGQLGLMSPFVWMFISTYREMRERLLFQDSVTSLVQLEYSGFDGATVPICAFTVERGHRHRRSSFVRLADFVGPAKQGPSCQAIIQASSRIRARESGGNQQMARHLYWVDADEFRLIPGSPIVYWLPIEVRKTFSMGRPLADHFFAMNGMTTGENARFVRYWYEVSQSRSCYSAPSPAEALESGARWFPYNKGGGYRKWYGHTDFVINWERNGADVIAHGRAFLRGRKYYFRPMVSWGKISSSLPSFRYYPSGHLFDVAGTSMFSSDEESLYNVLAFCNSVVAQVLLGALSPTLNFESGQISALPIVSGETGEVREHARELVRIFEDDWNSAETARGFGCSRIVFGNRDALMSTVLKDLMVQDLKTFRHVLAVEERLNEIFIDRYGLSGLVDPKVALSRVSLLRGPYLNRDEEPGAGFSGQPHLRGQVEELVSYAVGCMFGRYSLDEPGLILASQGDTLQEYLARVPNPSFPPDRDNVIPIVDGDWFEDDIVVRFRRFLRVAFGEEHFEENLRFVTETLGVKDLRDYFLRSFYKDHVQRYKKRPIYWLFSSPKGSFNALIYMHRYTPSTVSTVLNEYLREFKAKLVASRQHHERLAAGGGTPRQQAAALKEVDRLRKVLLELEEYEHDVLYPLATRQIAIDLDDGVKANYPKFGAALKKIPGLEARDE